MSISDAIKIDKAYKVLQNLGITSPNRQWYEEAIPSGIIQHADSIWAEDPTDPTNQQARTLYVLTADSGNNKSWVARSTPGDPSSSNMVDWIPESYGVSYRVKIYDNAGTEIPVTDPINWLFDYKNGVLLIQNPELIGSYTYPLKITGYQYIGDTVADFISNENLWDRNSGSGYLFPHALTDKVAIGHNTPNYNLDVQGTFASRLIANTATEGTAGTFATYGSLNTTPRGIYIWAESSKHASTVYGIEATIKDNTAGGDYVTALIGHKVTLTPRNASSNIYGVYVDNTGALLGDRAFYSDGQWSTGIYLGQAGIGSKAVEIVNNWQYGVHINVASAQALNVGADITISNSLNTADIRAIRATLTDNTTTSNYLGDLTGFSCTFNPRAGANIQGIFLDSNAAEGDNTGHAMRVLGHWQYGISMVGTFASRLLNLSGTGGTYGIYLADQPTHGIVVINAGSATTNAYSIWATSRGSLSESALGTGGGGVYSLATADTGAAGIFEANHATPVNAFAIYAKSTQYAGKFVVEDATTNTVINSVIFQRGTTGTAANGIGFGLQFNVENDGGTQTNAASLEVSLSSVSTGSARVQLYRNITGVKTEVLNISNNGYFHVLDSNQPNSLLITTDYSSSNNNYFRIQTTTGGETVHIFNMGIEHSSKYLSTAVFPSTTNLFYWWLDAASAQGAGTYSGTSYGGKDLTVVGSIATGADVLGNTSAVVFDGSNDYLYINDAEFRFATSFNAGIWAYREDWTDSSTEALISVVGAQSGWQLRFDDGNIQFLGYALTSWKWGVGVDVSKLSPGWHFIAAVRNNTSDSHDIYVDHILMPRSSFLATAANHVGEGNLEIGSRLNGNDKWTGRLQMPIIQHGVVWVQEDIDDIYNRSAGLFSISSARYTNEIKFLGDENHNKRILGTKGNDVLSANDMLLSNGNLFYVTGTTTINGIYTSGWTKGSIIVLHFASTPTVKHNTAASTGFASLQLSGAGDFSATAGDTLTLIYDGTYWREISRTVI